MFIKISLECEDANSLGHLTNSVALTIAHCRAPSRMESMYDLIGAPFDLCGPVLGSRLGPAAVRLVGVVEELRELGIEIIDQGDAFEMNSRTPSDLEARAVEAMPAYRALKSKVSQSYAGGRTPIVVSGDHSLALATISAAMAEYGDDLAVLWVDAHMDLNTPGSSPSGNIHGMPVAAIMRMDSGNQINDSQTGAMKIWPKILEEIVPGKGLRASRMAWIGLRDVDSGEVSNYKAIGGTNALTMQDVDRIGIRGAIEDIKKWLDTCGAKKLWVSFDVDAFDPLLAPGTGTKVRGGLTYREGHFIAESINEYLSASSEMSLAGVDVVEVNPMTDRAGETAQVACEWLCSLLGRKIMGDRN